MDQDTDYFVPDEQMLAFGAQTVERRLRWLDETREFILQTASAETRRRWAEERHPAPHR
jgi:hypothetical protein